MQDNRDFIVKLSKCADRFCFIYPPTYKFSGRVYSATFALRVIFMSWPKALVARHFIAYAKSGLKTRAPFMFEPSVHNRKAEGFRF